ncbi:MAG: efflux RND transporter permease subunit [Alphaproteobacteria bacterium]|nr:efflux RND transporter permease subunit [Alphaproteobacteria bacterium]
MNTHSLSGGFTRFFIRSPLTPLLLGAVFIVGLLALVNLPREEEPQISVPMVDIFVRADGLKARDAEELVTKPLEVIIKAIPGVEHVYSQTEDGQTVVTARFYVGSNADDAVLRVHDRIRSHLPEIPYGITMPVIVGKGIDDVAILVLTLSPKPEAAMRWDDVGLYQLALQLQEELIKIEDIGVSAVIGGRPQQLRIEPLPEKLSLYGVTLNQLVDKVQHANRTFPGGLVRNADRSFVVDAGRTLQSVSDIGLLLVATRDGRPVYLKDVAHITASGKPLEQRAWFMDKNGEAVPAVSLSLAKRPGANAVTIAGEVRQRLKLLKGKLLPEEVDVTITRDYGKTASEKSNRLLEDLLGATISVIVLVSLAIGWREGMVVLFVIPATILATLFIAWIMDFTINRVSLFALIFSIGILVDDAIVFTENIVRRWRAAPDEDAVETAIAAVVEVGNPTIMATFTIIAALLPMLFVSGLMGPYMSPIPINASVAMFLSLLVAFTVVPWLLLKFRKGVGRGHRSRMEAYLDALYRRFATPVITNRRKAKHFLQAVAGATLLACLLFATKSVTVKMLPFDNKSELIVQADLPEGSTLETTDRALREIAASLKTLPELQNMQLYAGIAAPFNFNGLVRHSYLRGKPELGEAQINLVDKSERSRASHAIALEVRRKIQALPMPEGTVLKVLEVPPGPPVLATLLAEIYGPTPEIRRAVALKVKEAFRSVDYVTDIDDSFGVPAPRARILIDQEKLEYYGVEEEAVYDTIQALLGSMRVGYSHRGGGTYPLELSVELPKDARSLNETLLTTPVPSRGGVVELGDVVRVEYETASHPIFRHNGYNADMVMAELAGRFEAPIYGMLDVEAALEKIQWGDVPKPTVKFHGQPLDESKPTLLWDGEWEITYVTFRDMGAAFGVAILGIYALLVAQFRSFRTPIVILVPVPLVLLGIILGHWLFSAAFTATSMIGMIALAGIVVRNSLLLVEFIRHRLDTGEALQTALLEAGATRITPILLTALAAMIGALFMFSDPIFQGLAISLFFGLMSSTALTLLAIPAVYVVAKTRT